ncbi:hypothetical protein [Flavobacterium sp.]|uniref:hypothetical protein n=1 Tax=Flavobacterium sp. TaxID=239 RepID=UPI00286C85A5|nr:hypothetical protein [Flavobacterium sp.]
MKNLEIKRISLANIESKMSLVEMESIKGSRSNPCESTTMGIVCGSAAVLLFTPFFELAPISAVACSVWASANHCG